MADVDSSGQGSSARDPIEISHGLEILELTPIEEHAGRGYIRISMATSYGTTLGKLWRDYDNTAIQVKEAFCQTLERWPILSGTFGMTRSDGQERLVLFYSNSMVVWETNVNARFTQDFPLDTSVRECKDVHDLPLDPFLLKHSALPDHDPDKDDLDVPVAIRVRLIKEGAFVISFAFSEIIFDGLSIQNFLREFLLSTHLPNLTFQPRLPIGIYLQPRAIGDVRANLS